MASVGNLAYVLTCKLGVASARTGSDPLRLASRVRHLGDAYYYARRPELAEACFLEALSIYRHHEGTSTLDLANAIRSFAVLKEEFGAAEDAQGLWQEAHDLYVTVDAAAGVAESAGHLALLVRRQGDLQRGRQFLIEANAAANAAGDPETLQYMREVSARMESAD